MYSSTPPSEDGGCPISGNGYVTCAGEDGILRYVCSPSGGTTNITTSI